MTINYHNSAGEPDQLLRSRNLWRAAAIGFMITTALLIAAVVALSAALGWNSAWR